MSENLMTALLGSHNDQGGDVDWKKKYDELHKIVDLDKIETGRLKKANEEIASLRQQLEALKQNSGSQDLVNSLPEEIGEVIPTEIKQGSAMIAQRAAEEATRALRAEVEQLKRDSQSNASIAFNARINSEFPGFLASVAPGGANKAAWDNYCVHNSDSIKFAVQSNNFDTLAYHIRMFYRNDLESPLPRPGTGGAAIPDPKANIGGGMSPRVNTSSKTYTNDDIAKLYDEIEAARDRGMYSRVRELNEEIQKAYAEGRVK